MTRVYAGQDNAHGGQDGVEQEPSVVAPADGRRQQGGEVPVQAVALRRRPPEPKDVRRHRQVDGQALPQGCIAGRDVLPSARRARDGLQERSSGFYFGEDRHLGDEKRTGEAGDAGAVPDRRGVARAWLSGQAGVDHRERQEPTSRANDRIRPAGRVLVSALFRRPAPAPPGASTKPPRTPKLRPQHPCRRRPLAHARRQWRHTLWRPGAGAYRVVTSATSMMVTPTFSPVTSA